MNIISLIRSIDDNEQYEIEDEGNIEHFSGKELKAYIITNRHQINFKLEQRVDFLTEKNEDGRDLQPVM